ncbi:MAG: 30S ribosomal protein S3 [Patescibacteria group bacterium]|jgi:small subunit ribosomal protein S3
MGHKVNPLSFRLPLNHKWQSIWFSDKNYAELLHADIKIRNLITKKYRNSGVDSVNIARGTNEIIITISTAKPGLIIGRSGSGVNDLKASLEKIVSGKMRLNIEEIKKPDLKANLIAQSIVNQIERRVSYRRAMKQAVEKSIVAGAKGIKIMVSGRLNGAEIARSEKLVQGPVTLATLRSDIDYACVPANTTFGVIGVKVWIYLGVSDANTSEN